MADLVIKTGAVIFTKGSRAAAMMEAERMGGVVHIIEVRNTTDMRTSRPFRSKKSVVEHGFFMAEDPAAYLVVPVGQGCPCCGALGEDAIA